MRQSALYGRFAVRKNFLKGDHSRPAISMIEVAAIFLLGQPRAPAAGKDPPDAEHFRLAEALL
jgi:hypothetical protein